MRTRRFLIVSLSCLLLSATVFCGSALADDSFSADGVTVDVMSVNPPSLAGDGQVTVKIGVSVDTSRADGGITGVHVAGGGVNSETVDEITIGDSQTMQFTLSLTAQQLNAPVSLSLAWNESAGGVPFTVTVPSSVPTDPQVAFSRTVDKTLVAQGGKVELVYTVKNTGTVDISDITVTDDGVDPALKLTEPALAVGAAATLKYTHTVNADFTSTPKLSYKANGTTYTATCPAKGVSLLVAELEAKLSVIAPDTIKPGDGVTLVCDLTNTGNVKMTNIVISEPSLGGKLFTVAALDKDASIPFSKTVPLTQTTKFKYAITAKDELGNSYTAASNEVEVVVSPGNSQYDIEIMASPDAIQLAEPGNVNFEIVLTNKGQEVANVTLSDQEGNPIKEYPSLPVGVTKFTYTELVEQTTTFNFTLSAPGPDGTYARSTGPLEIKVAEPTPTPELTDPARTSPSGTESSQTNGKPASGIGNIVMAMLVVGGLIAVTIVVLAVMIVSDKMRRKRR